MESALVTEVLLPGALGVIMLSLGTTLTAADFRRVAIAPRGVAIGMVNMALVSPLLAVTMATLFGLPPELAVGLVLLGASPGGMMANVLTHLSRGDTALSVTMTAVSSVGALVTVPLFLGLSTSHFGAGEIGDPSMAGVVARVFAVTVLPVSIGMTLRHRWPDRVDAAYPTIRRIAASVFALVVVGSIVTENETVREHAAEVMGAALALNLSAMSISFGVSKLARLDDRQATAIALELGIHNGALAIAIGASLAVALTIPAAVYSSFMLFTGGAFAWMMSRRNRAAEPVGLAP